MPRVNPIKGVEYNSMAKTRVLLAGLTATLTLGLGANGSLGGPLSFTPSYEQAPTPIIRHNPRDTDASWLNDANVNQTARKYLNKALRPDTIIVYFIAAMLTGGGRVDKETEERGLDEKLHSEKAINV